LPQLYAANGVALHDYDHVNLDPSVAHGLAAVSARNAAPRVVIPGLSGSEQIGYRARRPDWPTKLPALPRLVCGGREKHHWTVRDDEKREGANPEGCRRYKQRHGPGPAKSGDDPDERGNIHEQVNYERGGVYPPTHAVLAVRPREGG
jgi:hypothetical protein